MKRIILLLGTITFCGAALLSTVEAGRSASRAPRLKAAIQAGELIQMKASVAGVEGGTSSFLVRKVKQKGQDTHLHAMIKARTNTFFDKIHKVNNIFSSWFPLYSDGDFRYRLDVDQAGLKQLRRIHFKKQGKKGTVTLAVRTYANKRGPVWRPWRRRYRVPKNTRNLVSALYHARFLPYEKGKRYNFHVFVLGKVWGVQGRFLRKTRILTAIGKRRAIEVEALTWYIRRPHMKRRVRIWLSDDQHRLPLRIIGHVPRIGTAKAELTSYRRNYHSRTLNRQNHRSRKGRWGFLSDF
ncbi:MAG: DUF3108 domain-containing protein [Deltaproteobacteria bacterium]|nr:MAG: DUF3108 domain-containing protein [Deltaproteobacteria bacterium]